MSADHETSAETASVHGAPSWRVENEWIRMCVSERGGMMAPVEFRLGERWVSPYSVSPWDPSDFDDSMPYLLRGLRGDFFCMPFGGQSDGPPHGEAANDRWTLEEAGAGSLRVSMNAGDVGGRLEKEFGFRDGHRAIYGTFRISGVEGSFNYGTHPILDASGAGDDGVRLSVSPFRWGSVSPGVFSDPEMREYQALRPGAEFGSLEEVPLFTGGNTDLTRFPNRKGFEDLVMMVSEGATEEQPFAWSAAVFPGYVWFALKNPSDFPSTLFWLSNGGRHAAPWNGRHFGRVGIEEVCSYFALGLEASREKAGEAVPTVREFRRDSEVELPIIQAVAPVPDGFGMVESIRPAGDGLIAITGADGQTVETRIDWKHVC